MNDNKELERLIKYDTVVALVQDGNYTLDEAENIIGVKLSEEYKFEKLSSKSNGFYIKTKKGEMPDYLGWSSWVKSEYKFATQFGDSYIYDKSLGHYRAIADIEIEHLLIQTTGEKAKPQHFGLFLKNLKALCFSTADSFKSIDHKINLQNGILDLRANKLLEHNHEYFFTYKIPVKHDSGAKCDEWLSFLNRIFPDNPEYKIICAQIFGYILYGGDQWLHKAFVLYGEGRNGKSTFLHVLQRLIGRDNYSCVSLANLDKPFSVVSLNNKLANITGETPSDRINAEIFKAATSGEELTAAKKFKDEFTFNCNARFIFACNDLPRFGENTVGMQERLYFIPFTKYFEKSERRNDMKQVLEIELSGILNWALSGLSILLDEKYLPEIEATNQLMNEYNIENDSVYAWAAESIQQSGLSSKVSAKDMYRPYVTYCSNSGRRPVSDSTFFKRLKKYLKGQSWFIESEMFDKKQKKYSGFLMLIDTKISTSEVSQLKINRADIYQ